MGSDPVVASDHLSNTQKAPHQLDTSSPNETLALELEAWVDDRHRTSNDADDVYRDTESLLDHSLTAQQRNTLSLDADHQLRPKLRDCRYCGINPQSPVIRIWRWTKGPEPPRIFQIRPVFATVENRLLEYSRYWWPDAGYLVRTRSFLFWTFANAFLFALILGSSITRCQVPPYGSALRVSCVSKLWTGGFECGVDGRDCLPFDNTTYAFRCPANCGNVRVLEPYAIGAGEINYRSLVIGGKDSSLPPSSNPIYRGDSFICAAAIHAGVVNDRAGGAGVISLLGEQNGFPSTFSNGISSIGFEPGFPLSFTLRSIELSGTSFALCQDPRWILLAITLIYTSVISLFTTSSAVVVASTLVSGYFCVALAIDAPEPSNYSKVVSLAFEGFLPAAFVMYIVYIFCIKRTLDGIAAPAEKSILWLGSFWIGALSNLTFENLPIQRLTPHDLQAEPGAMLALGVILLIIIAIAILQIRVMRLEGRLRMHLAFYSVIALLLLLLLAIPGVSLRLHHYIIALLLLPGTAIQTRPSLVFQGLLVGLFINGIARWGFDSILQVPSDLVKVDLSGPFPHVQSPQITADTISFPLEAFNARGEAISILVNDVERFRSFKGNISDFFSWTRSAFEHSTFFRFGFVQYGKAGEDAVARYSKPATWFANGTWLPAAEI